MLISKTLYHARDYDGEQGWMWGETINTEANASGDIGMLIAHDFLEHPNLEDVSHGAEGVLEELRAFGCVIFHGRAWMHIIKEELDEFANRLREMEEHEELPEPDAPVLLDDEEMEEISDILEGVKGRTPLCMLRALCTGYKWGSDTYGSSGQLSMIWADLPIAIQEALDNLDYLDGCIGGDDFAYLEVTVDTETREITIEPAQDYLEFVQEMEADLEEEEEED